MKKEIVAYSKEGNISQEKSEQEDKNEEVYYNRYSNRQRGEGSYRRGRGGRTRQNWGQNWRGRQRPFNSSRRGTNPLGYDGNPSTCHICGSINHWARGCPEKSENQDNNQEAYLIYHGEQAEYTLMASAKNISDNDTSLLGETIGCMVLDSGTTSTVGGLTWFDCFVETLTDDLRKKMVIRPGKRSFKFGTGQKLLSLKSVTLPCVIGNVRVDINADIVDAEIPLLLSKTAMKKAKTSLDFENDIIWIFGRKMKLETTSSGHYFVPITKPIKINYEYCQVLLIKEIEEKTRNEKFKIAKKLHWQFSHPSGSKL